MNKKKYKHKCDTLYKNSKVLTDLAYIWLFIEKIAQHITNIEHQTNIRQNHIPKKEIKFNCIEIL